MVYDAVVQWLRCCATNRKVAGSIPDGVIGIFHSHNPSDRTMALGSTQPLTEMSTRSIFWGKGGRCVGLTTLPPSCAVVMISGNLKLLETSGSLQACNGTALPFKWFMNAIWIVEHRRSDTARHIRNVRTWKSGSALFHQKFRITWPSIEPRYSRWRADN